MRKYRRTIDPRVASLARNIASGASGNEKLQEALMAAAISACTVAAQVQALLTVCKTTANSFMMAHGPGETANNVVEVFGKLGQNLMKAADGSFTEALEGLVAMSIESLPADQRMRAMTSLAQASGLDPSQIALDYEEHSVDVPEEGEDKGDDPAPQQEPMIEYNSFSMDAFTEIAAVRRLTELQIKHDPDGMFLVGLGHDGRSWFRITRLHCDETEAQRVLSGVRNRMYHRT